MKYSRQFFANRLAGGRLISSDSEFEEGDFETDLFYEYEDDEWFVIRFSRATFYAIMDGIIDLCLDNGFELPKFVSLWNQDRLYDDEEWYRIDVPEARQVLELIPELNLDEILCNYDDPELVVSSIKNWLRGVLAGKMVCLVDL